jgi:hypothetical protein
MTRRRDDCVVTGMMKREKEMKMPAKTNQTKRQRRGIN